MKATPPLTIDLSNLTNDGMNCWNAQVWALRDFERRAADGSSIRFVGVRHSWEGAILYKR